MTNKKGGLGPPFLFVTHVYMPASEVAGVLQARPHATKFHYPPVNNSKDSDDKVLPVPRFWQKKSSIAEHAHPHEQDC
ncbi:hypothetical protein [Desulfovibrio sp. UIB00]|uniref:hypothetical protein n=1 Tax=Desulfovibrio sp. UIB00 TaxID=2804314 RepID=UPI001F0E10BC|nr:hypothetical protein [Desulfovibrio sp. UIB00]